MVRMNHQLEIEKEKASPISKVVNVVTEAV